MVARHEKGGEVVSFSTKGSMGSLIEMSILTEAVRYTVDCLPRLRAIVVYDCCGDDKATREIFAHATESGIEVVIPSNALKTRNATLRLSRERGLHGQD